MTEHISQKQLENYLWGAATLLRGVIDASDYKSIIFPLMFFKRISDVYDEEYDCALKESKGDTEYASYPEQHIFQIPAGCHWKDIRQVTKEVGRSIKTAMENIEKANPDKLIGIFGDSNWTNKDRLTDSILINLIEHFSTLNLSAQNVPQDEFGTGYEFLIKKFAEDSGHTAAEFYTNRTVVKLMALILDPKPGESIYDPTCGSGGMLLNSALLVKEKGQEYRSLKLYGQEINQITSGIARMNMFIHGFNDFQIVRGDTLKSPGFHINDKLMKFDIVIANPPYSIKKWNQELWKHDPWGRNIYGTPPQGCADYAFFQHIICSMKEDTGRCAILWPHGVLFRDSEQEMRSKLVEDDYVDAIIGMGPNLFYNSPMDSCIIICNKNKPAKRKGQILFIRAYDQIIQENSKSSLTDKHINNIYQWYIGFEEIPGRTKIVDINDIRKNKYVINVALYVLPELAEENQKENKSLKEVFSEWKLSSEDVSNSFVKLKIALKEVIK